MFAENSSKQNPATIPDNAQIANQQVLSQITNQMVADPFLHIQTLTKLSKGKAWISQLKSMTATPKWGR